MLEDDGTLAGAPVVEVLEADPQAGATKAMSCAGCHGMDGNAVVPIWPKLAGQRADYIAKQLHDFKAARRSDPTMNAMAAPLSDQDIEDLAAHFEQQARTVAPVDAELAAIGEQLFLIGAPERNLPPCQSCHGAEAEGFHVNGGFPALAGQHPDYIVKQLTSFRSESRGNDWNGSMRYVAKQLTDDEIRALAAYLAGVDPAEANTP